LKESELIGNVNVNIEDTTKDASGNNDYCVYSFGRDTEVVTAAPLFFWFMCTFKEPLKNLIYIIYHTKKEEVLALKKIVCVCGLCVIVLVK